MVLQSFVDGCARAVPRKVYRSCPPGLVGVMLLIFCVAVPVCFGQQPQPEASDALRGTVLNRVTHEAIPRALVFSPDNRFATMTDGEGRFEFVFPEATSKANRDSAGGSGEANRPYMLTARKPGFLIDPDNEAQGVQISPQTKDVTIELVPEALIIGHVSLPSSEAPDKIALELYRHEVRDGLPHWVPSAATTSTFSGNFRFSDLRPGTYKLFTRELPDTDPNLRGVQQYAYPPVYFPNASDFASAAEIELVAGRIVQAELALTRQPYFPVHVPVMNVQSGFALNVTVSMQGRHGPGYALDYNAQEQRIEGALPNGNFTLEALGAGQSGSVNIAVRSAPVDGPALVMVPGRSINVNVKEEFTSSAQSVNSTGVSITNGRSRALHGPRSYLNVFLEPAEDFDQHGSGSLRQPTGTEEDALRIEGVQPGRYWVRVTSSRGYASAVTSGGIDLLHAPLLVGLGGAVSPIEVTMRDDTAQIDGTVEGLSPDPANSAGNSRQSVHIYCIPSEDSAGQFTALPVSADGKIFPVALPPGTYRILAFRRPHPDLEYRNPEAMRAYDGKGPVVRVVAGQNEHLRVPLISGE